MNWRSIALNGIITLGITVLGGLLVYFLTTDREPSQPLVHSIEEKTRFSAPGGSIIVYIVHFRNQSKRSLENFTATITLNSSASIIEYTVTSSLSSRNDISFNRPVENLMEIRVPLLASQEKIEASFLVRTINAHQPIVFARSTSNISVDIEPVGSLKEAANSKHNLKIAVSVLFIALTAQMVLFIFSGRLRSTIRSLDKSGQANNLAFIYLHMGFFEEAKNIIEQDMSSKGADPIILANHGLAVGLTHDLERGLKEIDAAEWYSLTKHEKSISAFNRAILYQRAEREDAYQEMERARKLSRREIDRYLEFSILARWYASAHRSGRQTSDRSVKLELLQK